MHATSCDKGWCATYANHLTNVTVLGKPLPSPFTAQPPFKAIKVLYTSPFGNSAPINLIAYATPVNGKQCLVNVVKGLILRANRGLRSRQRMYMAWQWVM